jgi:hypothetical protein
MHQPDLAATLPELAAKLDKVKLRDRKMEADKKSLAAAARASAAAMTRMRKAAEANAPLVEDLRAKRAALDEARDALKSRCAP